MAVTVCESSPQLPAYRLEKEPTKINTEQPPAGDVHGGGDVDDDRPGQADIWNLIQSQKPPAAAGADARQPYVHPPVRRSSSLLSQKSLEVCTESLGSETGSDGFSDADATDHSCPNSDDDESSGNERAEVVVRAPPPRSFPPPLPSLSRRTIGARMQMRPHRHNGRLVVEAVPVPSPTLFRAQRRGGRLLLSFADTATTDEEKESQKQQEVDDDAHKQMAEEDEEEVEVVDRGTMVEVKVSTQQQAQNNGGRVHRSSLVINKFVSAAPLTGEIDENAQQPPPPPRHAAGSTTTAAAAVAAASALSASSPEDGGEDGGGENKLLVTAKRRRSKEELLHHMRRCGQLRRQLFIWEPWGLATSS